MNPLPSTPLFFLGIDVGKSDLFCHLLKVQNPDKPVSARFDNTPQGLKSLLIWLKKNADLKSTLICMEQTGNYSQLAAEALFAAKPLACYVVNPRCIKAFNDRKLRRCKSDTADAKSIANFIRKEYEDLRVWKPQPKHIQRIKNVTRHIESLSSELAKLKTKLKSTNDDEVARSINRNMKFIKSEITNLKAKVQKIILKHAELKEKRNLLQSISGVGEVVSNTIISEIHDINDFQSARQLAAWCGVTPKHYESGTSGKTKTPITKVGSAQLRKALFMPAMVAMQHNPIIKEFAQRLKDNGKKGREIVLACERKLLHLIYGVLKSGKPFDANYINPNTPKKALEPLTQ